MASTQIISAKSIDVANGRFAVDYDMLKFIDYGGFGKVYQVKSKADGHVYAIKQIELLKEERNDVLINREVSILQTLNHVNVVRYHEAWREHGTPDLELDKVYIKMDYCQYNLKQVYDIITSVYKRKTHETICPVSYFIKLTLVEGILMGLGYLHDMGIMHRDIKQNNILVKQDGDCWTVKLCDFGLAKVEESGSQHTQGVGTVSYKAPEVKHGGEYNHLADMFSLGIMLIQFFDVNVNKQDIHPELKDLLARMIAGRAADRPPCSEIMAIIAEAPIIYDLNVVGADHHNISRLTQHDFLQTYYDHNIRIKLSE